MLRKCALLQVDRKTTIEAFTKCPILLQMLVQQACFHHQDHWCESTRLHLLVSLDIVLELIQARCSLDIVPEPTPKRKTLVERAAEPARIEPSAPPSIRAVNGSVKATTLAGLQNNRNASYASSVSSRTPSVSSRTTSGSSYTQSVGTGRPPSSSGTSRPQTAMSLTRGASGTRNVRPFVASENQVTQDGRQPTGKRKGTYPAPLPIHRPKSHGSLHVHKRGASHDDRMNRPYAERSSSTSTVGTRQTSVGDPLRDFSLCTGLAGLSLDPIPQTPPPKEVDKSKTPFTSQIPLPKTPTPKPSVDNLKLSTTSPSKTVSKPARLRSPEKKAFLTKGSTIEAWDTNGRLEDMEANFSQFKKTANATITDMQQMIQSSADERSGLKETTAIYKARGMFQTTQRIFMGNA